MLLRRASHVTCLLVKAHNNVMRMQSGNETTDNDNSRPTVIVVSGLKPQVFYHTTINIQGWLTFHPYMVTCFTCVSHRNQGFI